LKPAPFIVLGLLGSAAAVVAIIALIPSLDDFDPYNPLWNGLRGFTTLYNVTLTPTMAVSSLSSGKVLVVGASLNFTSSEVEALRGFIERGGLLVVLEDFTPTGYALLEALGFKVEIYNGILVDPMFYYKDYTLPRVRIWNITGYFNYGVAIREHDGACIGYSSAFSFVDLNSNNVYDSGEPRGPLCVAVEWRLGSGAVMLIADSSLPINSMLEVNGELLETLTTPTRNNVYVVSDKWSKGLYSTVRSHMLNFYNVVVETQFKYILAITLLAAYPIVLRVLKMFRGEVTGELEESVRRVLALHPNWDPRILRFIAEELRRRREGSRGS
jgi:hypothetical protein